MSSPTPRAGRRCDTDARWVSARPTGRAFTTATGDAVQIDKSQLLDLLRSQGNHDQAAQADNQLPDTVDTEQHAGILSGLGIDPSSLGGLGGGLGGLLGKII